MASEAKQGSGRHRAVAAAIGTAPAGTGTRGGVRLPVRRCAARSPMARWRRAGARGPQREWLTELNCRRPRGIRAMVWLSGGRSGRDRAMLALSRLAQRSAPRQLSGWRHHSDRPGRALPGRASGGEHPASKGALAGALGLGKPGSPPRMPLTSQHTQGPAGTSKELPAGVRVRRAPGVAAGMPIQPAGRSPNPSLGYDHDGLDRVVGGGGQTPGIARAEAAAPLSEWEGPAGAAPERAHGGVLPRRPSMG